MEKRKQSFGAKVWGLIKGNPIVVLLLIGAEADDRHFQLHAAVAGACHAVAALPHRRKRTDNARQRIERRDRFELFQLLRHDIQQRSVIRRRFQEHQIPELL